MDWLILLLAGVLEVVWATGFKVGLGRPTVAAGTLVALAASMGLLALALRTLPLGTAYAIWTGVGTLGTFAVGLLWFGDPLSTVRCLFAGLIVVGIIGLKVSG